MLASQQSIRASPPFVIEVAGASGLTSYGSLTQGIMEDALRSDTLHNLTIELVGDTWASELRASYGMLTGLVSGQEEEYGWSSVLQPSLTVEHFTLLSNTSLGIYFRGVEAYDLIAPEYIAVEVHRP